jgi:hypothetical protein
MLHPVGLERIVFERVGMVAAPNHDALAESSSQHLGSDHCRRGEKEARVTRVALALAKGAPLVGRREMISDGDQTPEGAGTRERA